MTDNLPATLVSEPSKTSISSEELLLCTGMYDALADIFHKKILHVGADGTPAEMGPDLSHDIIGSAASSVSHLRLELINMPELHSILIHYHCSVCFALESHTSRKLFHLVPKKER